MPTETFFRLPEQKREKLLEAIHEEFRRVPFSEVSINRIVQRAQIPRGSFYQYFDGKEDLMQYVLQQCHQKLFGFLSSCLTEHHGDLFAVALATYDRIALCSKTREQNDMQKLLGNLRMRDQRFVRSLQILRSDAYTKLMSRIDRALLNIRTESELNAAIDLLESTVCCAIAECICSEGSAEAVRERLIQKLELMKRGLVQPKEICNAC